MSILKYTKELGIIASYLFMLIAAYLLDWEPFGIFTSYLIEIVINPEDWQVMRVNRCSFVKK